MFSSNNCEDGRRGAQVANLNKTIGKNQKRKKCYEKKRGPEIDNISFLVLVTRKCLEVHGITYSLLNFSKPAFSLQFQDDSENNEIDRSTKRGGNAYPPLPVILALNCFLLVKRKLSRRNKKIIPCTAVELFYTSWFCEHVSWSFVYCIHISRSRFFSVHNNILN